MKQKTKEWLNFAKTDIVSCEKIIDEEFLTNVVAFHSQQAIEKSFKAIIEEFELKFVKAHNLLVLFDIVKSKINFKMNIEMLTEINELYMDSRYPSDFGLLPNGKPTLENARSFYGFAKNIYDEIYNLLK